jgi:hypothetical protein
LERKGEGIICLEQLDSKISVQGTDVDPLGQIIKQVLILLLMEEVDIEEQIVEKYIVALLVMVEI